MSVRNPKSNTHILVFHFSPQGVRGALLTIGEGHAITLAPARVRDGMRPTRFSFGLHPVRLVIASYASSYAVTFAALVDTMRKADAGFIEEPELENHISQAVWKLFDRYRNTAVRELDVNDLDMMLANVRVIGMKIDGHQVINPVGFRAKKLTTFIEETFLSRTVAARAKEVVPKGAEMVWQAEMYTILGEALARVRRDRRFLLVVVGSHESQLFLVNKEPAFTDSVSAPVVQSLGSVPWGKKNLLGACADFLKISPETAEDVLSVYREGALSPSFSRALNMVAQREYGSLVSMVRARRGRNIPLHFYPRGVFHPSFFGKRGGNELIPVQLAEIVRGMGFHIHYKRKRSVDDDQLLFTALPFFEYWHSQGNTLPNTFAKRRARWLLP